MTAVPMAATYAAHAHRFALDVGDEVIAGVLADRYAPLATPGIEPLGTYRLHRAERWRLTWEAAGSAEVVADSRDLGLVCSLLQWHINQRVIATPGVTMLHAAGAVRDGLAVVLPAEMESGKSTLVAGLVRAGWAYLSDEAITIADRTAAPYHKPLSLDPGSWPVLPDLAPAVPEGYRSLRSRQWQLHTQHLHADALAGVTPIAAVVLPAYRPDQPHAEHLLAPADALVALATCTFRWAAEAPAHFDRLAQLAAAVPCWQLVSNDLDQAVAAVQRIHAAAIADRVVPA